MAKPRLTEEQCTLRREQILDAARDILLDQGARGISTRAIARRLGISHMTLYRYFDSGAEIVSALRQRQRERQRLRLEALLQRAEEEPVEAVFVAWLGHHLRLGRDNPRVFRFLWLGEPEDAEDRETRDARMAINLQHVARLVEIGIQRGDFAPRDPTVAAATAISIGIGPMIMFRSGLVSAQELCDQMVEDSVQAALDYLRGGASRPTQNGERNSACALSDD